MSFRERVARLPPTGGAIHVRDEAGVRVLTLDHPAARNALSPSMMLALADAVSAAAAWPGLRALVIGGRGPSFCAGGDLAAVQAHLLEPGTAVEMQAFMRATGDALAALPCLVIAAVEGAALGGGAELLTACDLVFASPAARVGFVQAAMGVSPGFGGGRRLLRRVGPQRAVDLLTRATPLTATEALRVGLVDEVVDDPWSRALGRAAEAASLPPAAASAAKRLLLALEAEGARGPATPSPDQPDAEAETFASLWAGPEHVAALDRFRRR